jgi:SAM-dependent methyltransferase
MQELVAAKEPFVTKDEQRDHERELARRARERDEPTAWFDELYAGADRDPEVIPWADLEPNRALVEWLNAHPQRTLGRRTLVVGCGLGDDAEELSARGYDVTAFDISPAAIAWCKQRFPASQVEYEVADLFQPPQAWIGHFEFVVEIYTIQALWPELQAKAMESLASLLAPGGEMFLYCSGRNPEDDPGSLPFPLTRKDLDRFQSLGLEEVQFEDLVGHQNPRVRRFRVHYRKPD